MKLSDDYLLVECLPFTKADVDEAGVRIDCPQLDYGRVMEVGPDLEHFNDLTGEFEHPLRDTRILFDRSGSVRFRISSDGETTTCRLIRRADLRIVLEDGEFPVEETLS